MTTDTIAPAAQPTAELDPQAQAPAAEAPTDDAPTDDAQPAAEQKPELTPEQRAMRKMERRIHTLTAGRGAAQREAEMLREQLAQQQEQKPQDDDSGDKPAVDSREIDRLANERADDIAHKRDIARRTQDVLKAGSKLDGFDDAVNTVADEVPFTDARGRPTPFIDAVLDSDAPAAILHYLGNNPEEAAEFAGLTPAQIGRRIAKLEAKLAASAAKQTSKARAPLKGVQPGSSGDAGDGAKLTDEQWRANRFKRA